MSEDDLGKSLLHSIKLAIGTGRGNWDDLIEKK
jgi:hypothetical protein